MPRMSQRQLLYHAAENGYGAPACYGMIVNIVKALAEQYPDKPVCPHQNHGNTEMAFLSAMMDGTLEADAKTPASYAYNLHITMRVAQVAQRHGEGVLDPRGAAA